MKKHLTFIIQIFSFLLTAQTCFSGYNFFEHEGIVAGTLVKTKDGYKKIEEIKTGDLVACFDLSQDIFSFEPVLQINKESALTEVVNLTVVDDKNNNFWITVSPDQKFLIPLRTHGNPEVEPWVKAKDIFPQEHVIRYFPNSPSSKNFDFVKVISKNISSLNCPVIAYSITVSKYSNFCISHGNILIHNTAATYSALQIVKTVLASGEIAISGFVFNAVIAGGAAYGIYRGFEYLKKNNGDFSFKQKDIYQKKELSDLLPKSENSDLLMKHEPSPNSKTDIKVFPQNRPEALPVYRDYYDPAPENPLSFEVEISPNCSFFGGIEFVTRRNSSFYEHSQGHYQTCYFLGEVPYPKYIPELESIVARRCPVPHVRSYDNNYKGEVIQVCSKFKQLLSYSYDYSVGYKSFSKLYPNPNTEGIILQVSPNANLHDCNLWIYSGAADPEFDGKKNCINYKNHTWHVFSPNGIFAGCVEESGKSSWFGLPSAPTAVLIFPGEQFVYQDQRFYYDKGKTINKYDNFSSELLEKIDTQGKIIFSKEFEDDKKKSLEVIKTQKAIAQEIESSSSKTTQELELQNLEIEKFLEWLENDPELSPIIQKLKSTLKEAAFNELIINDGYKWFNFHITLPDDRIVSTTIAGFNQDGELIAERDPETFEVMWAKDDITQPGTVWFDEKGNIRVKKNKKKTPKISPKIDDNNTENNDGNNKDPKDPKDPKNNLKDPVIPPDNKKRNFILVPWYAFEQFCEKIAKIIEAFYNHPVIKVYLCSEGIPSAYRKLNNYFIGNPKKNDDQENISSADFEQYKPILNNIFKGNREALKIINNFGTPEEIIKSKKWFIDHKNEICEGIDTMKNVLVNVEAFVKQYIPVDDSEKKDV